jgi:acylphosphatase
MKRAHVFVYGKVQRVWFRMHTKDRADELNIKGWVKNLSNGSVEAVFEGDEKNIKKMITWCHSGAPKSEVTKVHVEFSQPKNEGGFKIKY